MTKLKMYFCISIAAFLFSCSKSSSDEAVVTPSNPGNTNFPPNVSTGDYWPTAINNEWVFDYRGAFPPKMKINNTTVINGKTYYTFEDDVQNLFTGQTLTGKPRMRKEKGDYFVRIEESVLTEKSPYSGATTGPIEYLLLKDYANVGESWTSHYTQTAVYTDPKMGTIKNEVDVEGKLLERIPSITINNKEYKDIIKSQTIVKTVSSTGQTSISTYTYWFAKGVGIIKTVRDTSSATFYQQLVSFVVN